MAESRVVIKINYDKDFPEKSATKLVTVWHYKRIVSAIVILVLLIILILALFSNTEKKNHSISLSHNPELSDPSGTKSPQVTVGKINTDAELTKLRENGIQQNNKKYENNNQKLRSNSSIIFDKNVIRASLNTILKDNEPYKQLIEPLKIEKQEKIELYYFNQLRYVKDKVLFHYWLKDGKMIFKKSFPVKLGVTKLVSSKIMTSRDNGNWQIQLQDKNGKVYCQVDFVIDTE